MHLFGVVAVVVVFDSVVWYLFLLSLHVVLDLLLTATPTSDLGINTGFDSNATLLQANRLSHGTNFVTVPSLVQ